MYCVRCGRQITDSDAFCPACGKPAKEAVPMMPVKGRIAGHVRLLGILWIALSAFRLIPGFVVTGMVESGFFPDDMPQFVHDLLGVIGGLFIFAGLIGIIAGWGLLARQGWARMLTIILGCLGLFDMPFGTALGIYTLWVLLPAQSEQEYKQIARAA